MSAKFPRGEQTHSQPSVYTETTSDLLILIHSDISLQDTMSSDKNKTNESQHEISNNVVYATSKASDQPAHMHSLIRAFASPLEIL